MDNDFPSLYTPPASSGGPGTGTSAAGLNGSNGESSYVGASQLLKEIHEQTDQDNDAAAAGTSEAGAAPNAGAGGSRKANRQLDFNSETAFPSLGGGSGASTQPVGGGWGAGAARARAAPPSAASTVQSSMFTESLVLPSASINVSAAPAGRGASSSSREQDPTTLGGVLSLLMTKFKNIKIESSTSTAKGTTTLLIKAQRQQDLERVKRDLMARIVKKVNETIQVPASTRAFIIGSKGKNLKSITEETGVNIQIPRDAVPASAAPASDEPSYNDDEEAAEDPLIPINLFGDMSSVAEAKRRIFAIVNERTSRLSTKISTIPHEFYHLLSARLEKGEVINEADAGSVDIKIPPVWKFRAGQGRGVSAATAGEGEDTADNKQERDNSITLVGDREIVTRAVDAIVAAADELARTTQILSMSLSKRQHRFILPPVSDQILAATACSVEVPPASTQSDQITIRGPSANLVQALQLVMEKANAASVDVIDLMTIHGINTPAQYPRNLARYLLAKAKLRKIADEESAQIYIPRSADQHSTIDIVATGGPKGPAAAVSAARVKVVEVLKVLPPSAFDAVEIDPLLHRFLIGRKGARIQAFEEKNRVQVVFPQQSTQGVEGQEDKQILLVYVGDQVNSASSVLKDVKEEIQKLAKEAADITTVSLSIPAQFHRHIIGPSGTTLNALIGTGDDRVVNVRFGSSGQAKSNGEATQGKKDLATDDVVIRGPGDEVKRIAKEVERIAEEAKNDEIVNSYTVELDIEQRFVSHIVGKGGAGISKLREELGVRIDFDEAGKPAEQAAGKAKKPASAKSHVKISGRKENAEEAKKRILRQTEQLADETTVSVPLTAGLERGALIGKQGSYVQRLETKYDVRINFPRAGDGKDEGITIRGGRKGVDGAKRELQELMDYEKENNQSTTVEVPNRALARIFGRAGAAIRELQDDTGAEIDVEKRDMDNSGASSTFTIRGTKAAIAQAKKAIAAVVSEVQDETSFEVRIDRSAHASIVGRGGSNIRDLVTRAGGPSDPRAAGALVRFPQAGEESDIVTVRGPKAVALKIKAELEKQAAEVKDRVVYGVAIPQSSHARIVGRGGAGVNELQRKHNVRIVLSGWQEYQSSGQLVNSADVEDAASTDVIKILGGRSACEAAAAELKEKAQAGQNASANRQQRTQESSSIVKTVEVPANLHGRVTQGGKFFRTLPNGIRIDHGDSKPPTGINRVGAGGQANGAAKSARIDADEDEDEDFPWEVTPLTDANADTTPVPWNIRGNDQAKVDRVEGMINAALGRCKTETHQGVLTVPQTLIPRIVGRQGSGLDKLRALGVSAEVEGRQGANQVIFLGTPKNLESAREQVLELSRNQKGR